MAKLLPVAAVLLAGSLTAQDAVVDRIVKEGTGNSQLEKLAHELLDKIGPRLTGTPQLKQANDWAVAKYTEWGVPARNEQWGEWKGWERGVTHIDMVSPRIKSLEGTQLAWSPSTRGKTVTGELVIIPDLADSIAFQQWLPNVKGKFVMVSMNQPTGRPDYNWQEFATKESFDKLKKERAEQSQQWTQRIRKTGYSVRMLQVVLEKAGAIGIVGNNWSQGFGVDKIFNAYTHKIPTVDIALEDYGLLYRLVESGANPRIAVRADSKDQGTVPVFNTLAEIKGTQKPDEYVMLSAHFDSWDGGTGATDNGTGTLTMMEAMRILKAVYPNPKRTILVGHWASEEQGLNGSRAFVEDHPEIVNKLQALFNQDNGTGRVVNISGQGFQHAGDFIKRWLAAVPAQLRDSIRTSFPGSPGGGGSDFASFVAVGAPGFSLSSLSWSYFNYTWHTNRDTYDKIVFDDLRNNAVLTAIMVYMASEDPAFFPRDRATLGNDRTGRPAVWPAQVKAIRKGPVAPAN
ncbi:M20/M25/M40 family metallo-hydrolase [Sediminibacterium sp. WSJ-3]|nr:M20/M25/M40 family metallo-hydrolase [Sediminibacterium soli]